MLYFKLLFLFSVLSLIVESNHLISPMVLSHVLDKAVVCLNQSQCILEDYVKNVSTESERSAAFLKEIKSAAHEINQHLLRYSYIIKTTNIYKLLSNILIVLCWIL